MSNKYKDMLSKIGVPHDLKKETLEKIRTAQNEQPSFSKNSPPNKKSGKVFSLSSLIKAGASLAAAALVVFVGTRLFLPSSSIITKLEAGVHTTNVELRNGQLNFVAIENSAFETPPNYGNRYGYVKKEATAEEFARLYLNTTTLPMITGYALVGSDIQVFSNITQSSLPPAMATATMLYEGKTGGNLDLTISTDPIPYSGALAESEKSEIADTTVYVGYNPEKDIYIVMFKKRDLNYYAEGIGLSQEEFIEILESLIKNN